MWTPDVYEGAPTPVTAFLATVPKMAAICLFMRVMFDAFGNILGDWQQIIVLLSILSMFLGAFAAIGQNDFKRLLAYSSIAHMGYALIGLAAGTEFGVQSVLEYMTIYITMNIGVFAILMSMQRDGQSVTEIASLRMISETDPGKAIALLILLFSLAGVPPMLGFFAKFEVLRAAINADLIYLAIMGVLASVIGAFYFFLNFRKLFLRSIMFFLIIILGLLFTDIPRKISELGRTDRVFLNVSKRGGSSESTQTRFELADRSYNLTKKYPFGIGAGNWQIKANKLDPTHLMAHEYPHNLIFEIFNEYGVIAGLIFIIYILLITILGFAKMINNNNNRTSLYPFLFYLWVFLLLNAMLSGSLDDGRFLFIISCCFITNKNLILKNE